MRNKPYLFEKLWVAIGWSQVQVQFSARLGTIIFYVYIMFQYIHETNNCSQAKLQCPCKNTDRNVRVSINVLLLVLDKFVMIVRNSLMKRTECFQATKNKMQILIVQTRERSFIICFFFTRNWSGIARENFKHKAQSSFPFHHSS